MRAASRLSRQHAESAPLVSIMHFYAAVCLAKVIHSLVASKLEAAAGSDEILRDMHWNCHPPGAG